MKQLGEVLKLSTSFLQERGVARARRTAEELLAHCLQMKRLDLYMAFDRPLSEPELVMLRPLVKRCSEHEPVEYVIGTVEFAGCQITVNKNVLIPRPETELLVEWVKKRRVGHVLWDVCTGSGALGIALKKAMPDLHVVLSDISPQALALAKQNGSANGVFVEFLEGDLLTPFSGRKADMIVCNPPYLSEVEFTQTDPSVRQFEPKQALVAGARGTELYEQLASKLPECLNVPSRVFLEIGSTQSPALRKIFSDYQIQLEKDWAGHDRFFFLEKDCLSE